MSTVSADALYALAFASAPAALAIVERTPGEVRVTEMNRACQALLGGDASAFIEAISRLHSKLGEGLRGEIKSNEPLVISIGRRSLSLWVSQMTGDQASHLVLELREGGVPAPEDADLGSYVNQLRSLVDRSTAVMYIKDRKGRFLVVNQHFTRWFGKPAEDILGLTNWELFPKSVADAYAKNDERVLATGVAIEVEEPQAKLFSEENTTPTRRWLSIKFPLLGADGVPYAVGGISTDITDRKRAELAAREAMLKAERANKSKDEFLSRMSHELRTPLNAILGFAQLLRDGPLEDPAIEHVEHILQAGQHLLSLVNDALDLSWIEAGTPGMRLESVPAAVAIHRALEFIRPLAVAKDVEIASDLHAAMHRNIVADPQRLRQVFLNLLGNAVKFNRPRGVVRVSCRVHDNILRYRITDTGPGLRAADRKVVFTPFSRLPGAAGTEGSGLGLALSRRLVERMGGDLGLERSAPGEGSTFFVDLPLDHQTADEPDLAIVEASAPSFPQLSGVNIVQIEDTEANQRLVEAILRAMGDVNLHSASTGRAGLRLIDEVRPDLVLLDLNLPDLSGTEVLSQLRAGPGRKDVPVIVLSADATPARSKELRALGVANYITKPIDVHDLATAISEILQP